MIVLFLIIYCLQGGSCFRPLPPYAFRFLIIYPLVSTLFVFFLFVAIGNTFSTLNGHVVEWQLLSDEEAVHQKEPGAILNFIPFEESTYSTDPAIRRLEAEVRSHRSELKG